MAVSAPVRRTPAAAKPAARRSLIIIGVAMALLAFILVIVLGTVIAGKAAVGTTQVAVLTAAHVIHHRDVIKAADLTGLKLPLSAVPPGALTVPVQAIGKVAQVDMLAGQTLTTNLVATLGTGDPGFLPIPQGWVATTIPAGEQQAVGGYVAPGDVIDISVTVSETAFAPTIVNPRQLAKTVFPAVHILRVGPSAVAGPKDGQVQGIASSLTVLMTPCDSQYLTWLIANGAVRYSLRSATDYPALPVAPDATCPVGSVPVRVGPAEVDKKFGFTAR
jgi:pilus assembly protein CpaB